MGRGSPGLLVPLSGEQGWAPDLTGSVFAPSVPPAVTVTCSQALEGTDNLTCQAVSFSPQNISVAWYQDEKAVSPDTQQSGGVLPDGNGTYQTWVTLRVPQGEEQRFSCHVEHGGNHSVHAVPCGEPGGMLEGVLPLGEPEARLRGRRAGLWLWDAGVIRSPFCRKGSRAPSMVDHFGCSDSSYFHRDLVLFLHEDDPISFEAPR